MAVPSLLLAAKMCPLCITGFVPFNLAVLFSTKGDTICSSEPQNRPLFIVITAVVILAKSFPNQPFY